MMLLPHQQAHIWLTDMRTLNSAELEALYTDWLSEEEKARLEENTNPERRRQQLLSRAMVRWCLSQYSESISPSDWPIVRGPKGKPGLEKNFMALNFSVSHSGDWLALVITHDTTVGVDIEDKSRARDWRAIAQRYFAPEELAQLDNTPEDYQHERFLEIWTLKEAYFKACGGGISTGLNKAQFQIDNNGTIIAEFADTLNDDVRSWQFHHYQIGDDFCLSLALKQPQAQDAETHFYKTIPGESNFPLEMEARRVILQ